MHNVTASAKQYEFLTGWKPSSSFEKLIDILLCQMPLPKSNYFAPLLRKACTHSFIFLFNETDKNRFHSDYLHRSNVGYWSRFYITWRVGCFKNNYLQCLILNGPHGETKFLAKSGSTIKLQEPCRICSEVMFKA